MTIPISKDIRKRVINYIKKGNNCGSSARKFEISESSARRWYSRYLETGNCNPKPYPGKKPMLTNDEFISYVKHHPNSTLAQIGSHFGMSAKSAHSYMKKCKYSYKKKRLVTWKQKNIKEKNT